MEVRNGQFREDLWYRLNVFPITIPPLRQRKEDIPLLVKAFVNNFVKKIGKSFPTIPESVMNSLMTYPWPGNIRELKNVIERAAIISESPNFSVELPNPKATVTEGYLTLKEKEKAYLFEVLNEVNWKIEGDNSASKILGLNASTLRSKMKKLGLQKPFDK